MTIKGDVKGPEQGFLFMALPFLPVRLLSRTTIFIMQGSEAFYI